MSLEPKQEKFCREYLKDHNASQAYIRAGYAKRNANVNSSKLMAKDSIQRRVTELSKPIVKNLEISAQRILQELAEIAYDKKEYEPPHRLSALDKLGKHLKLFTDMDPMVTNFTVMGQVLVDGQPLKFNVGSPAPQFDLKNAPQTKSEKKK